MSSPYAHHSGTGEGYSGSGGTPTMKQGKGGARRAKFGGCCCAVPRGVSLCRPNSDSFLALSISQSGSWDRALSQRSCEQKYGPRNAANRARRLKDFLAFFGQSTTTARALFLFQPQPPPLSSSSAAASLSPPRCFLLPPQSKQLFLTVVPPFS